MSTQKSIEELYALHQEGKLSYIDLVSQSEYSHEYFAWCSETGLMPGDDTAFLFLEKKESDVFSATNQIVTEPIQFELV